MRVTPVYSYPATSYDRVMDRRDNPFTDIEQMIERMAEQFDEAAAGWSEEVGDVTGTRPAVDIADRPEEVVVTANVPGFSQEDIALSVSDRTLRIEAQRDEEVETDRGEFVRRERRRSSMSRSVRLPADVDAGAASAALQNGVLTVTLPKAERDDTRQIDIE